MPPRIRTGTEVRKPPPQGPLDKLAAAARRVLRRRGTNSRHLDIEGK